MKIVKCLICNQDMFLNELRKHIKNVHHLSKVKYKRKFGLSFICLVCGIKLSKNCLGELCNRCNKNGENNPFYNKKHSTETIQTIKAKTGLISKEKWLDNEYRKKVIAGTSKPRRESFKQEQSDRMTKWYEDNPNQKIIRSGAMKKSWVDGKIKPNINSINESVLEKELLSVLKKELFNHDVVKKTVKVGSKWYLPDIVVDSKTIVEFYGNFWHGNPMKYKESDIIHHGITAKEIWEKDKKRIDNLNKKYKVIVVWEEDYRNNKEDIVKNIKTEIENFKSV